MLNAPLEFTAALLIGLLGSSHCLGMCGGLAGALGFNRSPHPSALLISYNLGRITSYTVIGAVLGGAIALLQSQLPVMVLTFRLLAAAMLIAIGLYIGGWWMGLTRLEGVGQQLWRRIRPLGSALLPPSTLPQGFVLGTLWGWLPCGLVYSALAWAAASGSSLQSAWLMAGFGIGTLPALLLAGLFGQQLTALLQRKSLRSAVAIIFIIMGLWAAAMPLHHQWSTLDSGGPHSHSGHLHH